MNNFDLLESQFDRLINSNDCFFIQILQRKKDGNNISVGYKNIKSFYIFNKKEFREKESYIKELCDKNNARAYIRLNPRNTQVIACEAIRLLAEAIRSNTTNQMRKVWDRASGTTKASNYTKLWIVDIDDINIQNQVKTLVLDCGGEILLDVPTIHGIHLITSPFNTHLFKQKLEISKLPNIDIQKDNPTLLYYNETSN